MDPDQKSPVWPVTTRTWINKNFPERQVHLRTEGRVTYFRVSSFVQVLLAVLFLGTASWIGFASYSYIQHDEIVAGKNKLLKRLRGAYESLLGEVSEYQNKFTAITTDLEHNHALMLSLVERNSSLQENLLSISQELENTQNDRQMISDARESLTQKLAKFEDEMLALTSRNFTLTDNLNNTEGDLQAALSERNQAQFEGSRLRRHVMSLENRLENLQVSHVSSAARLIEQTTGQIASIENIIKLAGLDPKKLKHPNTKKPLGQGGPFIPAGSNDLLPAGKLRNTISNLEYHLDHLNSLKRVIQHLPLTAPVDIFTVTSRFGKRRDPINGRWSAHYGIDFGGTTGQSIYSPAPGKVIFAGWKGKYGRYVEIDHGSGVKTRYGHLRKILVKRGQKVKFRHKIALLGNSGRSTGAHLHYETVLNGKYVNPMKLLKAGKYVYQKE